MPWGIMSGSTVRLLVPCAERGRCRQREVPLLRMLCIYGFGKDGVKNLPGGISAREGVRSSEKLSLLFKK